MPIPWSIDTVEADSNENGNLDTQYSRNKTAIPATYIKRDPCLDSISLLEPFDQAALKMFAPMSTVKK
jgi:hypothetical protein